MLHADRYPKLSHWGLPVLLAGSLLVETACGQASGQAVPADQAPSASAGASACSGDRSLLYRGIYQTMLSGPHNAEPTSQDKMADILSQAAKAYESGSQAAADVSVEVPVGDVNDESALVSGAYGYLGLRQDLLNAGLRGDTLSITRSDPTAEIGNDPPLAPDTANVVVTVSGIPCSQA